MADVLWPAGLPQAPLVARYSQQDQERVVRTAMAVGPDKVRRRATAAIELCDIELRLTRTQAALLKTFFRDSVQAGAVPFRWRHHETGQAVDYRFLSPPVLSPHAPRQAGAEWWVAAFRLEAMPGTLVVVDPPDPPEPPGEPPAVFGEEPPPGASAAMEAMLQPMAVSYFDAPDVITPAADDTPFIMIISPDFDEPTNGAVIGAETDGVAAGGRSPSTSLPGGNADT